MFYFHDSIEDSHSLAGVGRHRTDENISALYPGASLILGFAASIFNTGIQVDERNRASHYTDHKQFPE